MIGYAGELGAGALTPNTSRDSQVVTADGIRAREFASRTRVSPVERVSSQASFMRVSVQPTLSFGSNAAGAIVSSDSYIGQSKHSARFYRLRNSPVDSDSIASAVFSYPGSETPRDIGMRSLAPNVAADIDTSRAQGVSESASEPTPIPYVSVIWSLVEAQQLAKARALLKFVPEGLEYARLKRLLSVATAAVSQRKDLDRSDEFRWLTVNARNHAGYWVAVSGDSLLAASKTLKELRQELQRLAPPRTPLVHFVE